MEVNSVKKVFNLINNLDYDKYKLNYEIRKIDYYYELTVGDYIIGYEYIPSDYKKYLEITYKSNPTIFIKLSKRNSKYFRLIFDLLLTNYLRNRRLVDTLSQLSE